MPYIIMWIKCRERAMKKRRNGSAVRVIELIDHMESDLTALKKALLEDKWLVRERRKAFQSVRELEFCGMWKDRKDLNGVSSAEWLADLRRKQWGRTR